MGTMALDEARERKDSKSDIERSRDHEARGRLPMRLLQVKSRRGVEAEHIYPVS